jgi:uncharacterized protein (DUF1810 family)
MPDNNSHIMKHNLSRFIEAQEKQYETALKEINNGKKVAHWMWYIFPQISGLGNSETAKFYAIENSAEAVGFLNNDILKYRLFEITEVLNALKETNVNKIFGNPDDLKLKSSMTLFYFPSNKKEIFKNVIDKYFNGNFCEKTIQLLSS